MHECKFLKFAHSARSNNPLIFTFAKRFFMKVHFIAIGGSAMHNLAIALVKKGYKITGSDDEIFEPSKSRLKKYGILPETEGWNPEKISCKS